MDVLKYRTPGHGVDPLFPNRWSPRAMSGEELDMEEMNRLFEAARWAPSSMNNQPWRILYARRNTEHWETFLDLLSENNRGWAKKAAVLIVMVSKRTFDFNGQPSRTHSYDTGAAWASLALQGSLMGLVVHGMQGFDYDRAKESLHVSDEFQVEAMAAVGRPGEKEDLPAKLQEREFPSDRKKLSEIALEGGFAL